MAYTTNHSLKRMNTSAVSPSSAQANYEYNLYPQVPKGKINFHQHREISGRNTERHPSMTASDKATAELPSPTCATAGCCGSPPSLPSQRIRQVGYLRGSLLLIRTLGASRQKHMSLSPLMLQYQGPRSQWAQDNVARRLVAILPPNVRGLLWTGEHSFVMMYNWSRTPQTNNYCFLRVFFPFVLTNNASEYHCNSHLSQHLPSLGPKSLSNTKNSISFKYSIGYKNPQETCHKSLLKAQGNIIKQGYL